MTDTQTTVLIIGCVITAFLLILLLFRLPGPIHLLGKMLQYSTHGPTKAFRFFTWLINGWKFSRWDAVKVPLIVTGACAFITLLAVLIIR